MAYDKKYRDVQSTALIDKNTIRQGEWYQPYIHSNPKNFFRAQKAHFTDLNYNRITEGAEKKAVAIFEGVLHYFQGRVDAFAKRFNLSENDLVDIVVNFVDNYERAMSTGIAQVDEIRPLLGGTIKQLEDFLKKQNKIIVGEGKSYVNSVWLDEQDAIMKAALKVNKGERTAKTQVKRSNLEARVKLQITFNYMQELFHDKGLNAPPELMGKLLQAIVMEEGEELEDFKRTHKEIVPFLEKLNEDEKKSIRLQEKLWVRPLDTKGKLKERYQKKPKKDQGASSMLPSEFGRSVNEEKVKTVSANTIAQALGNLGVTLRSALEGEIKKTDDVSDGVIYITYPSLDSKKTEKFAVGIDIKYTGQVVDGFIKYGRSKSKVKRPVSELTPLFPGNVLNDVTYLLTNLYLFQSKKAEAEPYLRAVLAVARFIQGILMLLPAQVQGEEPLIIQWDPQGIQKTVKNDTRIFVSINENFYLITDFLKGVKDSVFTLRDSKRTELTAGAGLQTMQRSWNAISDLLKKLEVGKLNSKKKPVGKYYDHKKEVLSLLGHATDKGIKTGSDTYSILKSVVADKATGSKILDGFKYAPVADTLWIKTLN